MIQPLQIRYRHVRPDPHLASLVHRLVDKLNRLHPRITRCHVSIARPHRRHTAGNHVHVRIEIEVPGATLVATRDPVLNALLQESDRAALHKQAEVAADRKVLRVALREAFDALARQLREYARRRRGDTKAHAPREPFAVPAPALLRRALA